MLVFGAAQIGPTCSFRDGPETKLMFFDRDTDFDLDPTQMPFVPAYCRIWTTEFRTKAIRIPAAQIDSPPSGACKMLTTASSQGWLRLLSIAILLVLQVGSDHRDVCLPRSSVARPPCARNQRSPLEITMRQTNALSFLVYHCSVHGKRSSRLYGVSFRQQAREKVVTTLSAAVLAVLQIVLTAAPAKAQYHQGGQGHYTYDDEDMTDRAVEYYMMQQQVGGSHLPVTAHAVHVTGIAFWHHGHTLSMPIVAHTNHAIGSVLIRLTDRRSKTRCGSRKSSCARQTHHCSPSGWVGGDAAAAAADGSDAAASHAAAGYAAAGYAAGSDASGADRLTLRRCQMMRVSVAASLCENASFLLFVSLFLHHRRLLAFSPTHTNPTAC
eukprot:2152529-Rhodomonas_salina.1